MSKTFRISIQDEVVALWFDQGESKKDIAFLMDLTVPQVTKILRMAGCTTK